MSPEEIRSLGAKIAGGTATPQEVADFLKVLNSAIGNMRQIIGGIDASKE